MKIVTYNLNGIRSAVSKGLLAWISSVDPDIVCFQETKAHLADIPVQEIEALGYHTYWFSAQKKGYSGVGVISKIKPISHTIGNGYAQSDDEGRVICLEFEQFLLIGAYFPSGSSGDERQTYKYQWLDEFMLYIKSIQSKTIKPLLICGDYNIAHHPVDIHDPIRNATSSGFLPEEREWMTTFLKECQLEDTYRQVFPHQEEAYTWWSFRANARANNKGWRIDYLCVSTNAKRHIRSAGIMPEAKHSDHCPAWVEMGW